VRGEVSGLAKFFYTSSRSTYFSSLVCVLFFVVRLYALRVCVSCCVPFRRTFVCLLVACFFLYYFVCLFVVCLCAFVVMSVVIFLRALPSYVLSVVRPYALFRHSPVCFSVFHCCVLCRVFLYFLVACFFPYFCVPFCRLCFGGLCRVFVRDVCAVSMRDAMLGPAIRPCSPMGGCLHFRVFVHCPCSRARGCISLCYLVLSAYLFFASFP